MARATEPRSASDQPIDECLPRRSHCAHNVEPQLERDVLVHESRSAGVFQLAHSAADAQPLMAKHDQLPRRRVAMLANTSS